MKHLTAIVLIALLPLCAEAQRIHAFLSSGLTVSQIEGDELKGFKQLGYCGGVGAIAALDANRRCGLSVEALFSQRGALSSKDPRYSLYYLNVRSSYVEIPLLVHWQDPWGGMLFGAGLSYGRLIEQPNGRVGNVDTLGFMPDTNDKAFLSRDLSVVADLRFTIWRGLQMSIRWQYSLLPIKRDWTFNKYNGYYVDANGDRHNRWITHTNDCYNHSLTVKLIYQF